ncbi:putative 4,5-dihydroxyphthalate dehydrogenase [Variibacter gotjawalensis]|uniref:Putative 4,5-dihydroxyphthalate dehydrogenase n=1 Tax=Variibacter gotjawalensis TaxID=1333996 RepID=A0A0S3PUH9_9BRAD|nr:Gfo/Idh/MocA family oxidoreductase [Variibacter gotjawalensis]NIK49943.1 putative dehydrogenase [Variibacter gotjawalensis]RZS45942.1 putative dehydrogenase [Variibacter gotjawalensis]BAT59617.1 putative 4,5-dihydroxyphthalate dehydrogenase [Variibacter gotjawalensis]
MIGVGILGAGFFGEFHARAVRAVDGVEVRAVCANPMAEAEVFAKQYGGTAYDDWRELIADSSVDAVVVATPHHLHAPMVIAALEAGKHVLVEKPMALSVAECDAVIAVSRKANTTLMVGHILHFAKPCLVAQDILARGELGRPLAASSSLVKFWMEENRRGWHLDPATGGGMLMTAGIHALDALLWFMGGEVKQISAAGGALFHEQKADDSLMLLVRFDDNRIGQVASVAYRDGAGSYGIDLICERGALRVDFNTGVSIGHDNIWTPVPDSAEPDWMQRAVEGEWQAMVTCIRDSAPPVVDGAYGRKVISCIAAALTSARESREVVPQ